MVKKIQNDLIEKTNNAKLGETLVSAFMNNKPVLLKANYSIKSTIEIFKTHHVTGAPVIDYKNQIIGLISEYDLLIQAASKNLNDPIEFKTQITAVHPETTLKEILIILYSKKLKWMPVINKENFVKGVISRIDILNYIANNV